MEKQSKRTVTLSSHLTNTEKLHKLKQPKGPIWAPFQLPGIMLLLWALQPVLYNLADTPRKVAPNAVFVYTSSQD